MTSSLSHTPPPSHQPILRQHGWRFDSTGACVDIPQAIGPDAVAKAAQVPRACAAAHPVSARPDGLLWVWPVAGEFDKATATPTGAPALSEANPLWMAHWFVRDCPFGVQELLENGDFFFPVWVAPYSAPAFHPLLGDTRTHAPALSTTP